MTLKYYITKSTIRLVKSSCFAIWSGVTFSSFLKLLFLIFLFDFCQNHRPVGPNVLPQSLNMFKNTESQWTRMGFLAWLIVGVKYYSHLWLLHTTGLLCYQGPQKIFKKAKKFLKVIAKATDPFHRNSIIFCLIWTVST